MFKSRIFQLPKGILCGYHLAFRFRTAAGSSASLFIRHLHEDTTTQKHPAPWKPKLIIFDKNGTLFNFHSKWSPWITSFAQRLAEATGLKLEEKLYQTLDVCIYTNKARSGVLAQGTSSQIKAEVLNLLNELGVPEQSATTVIEECWEECDVTSNRAIREYQNLKTLFEHIKHQDIKIAVCTSDSRRLTEKTLKRMDLISYVDDVRCGDDLDIAPKPDPKNVQDICENVDVAVDDAVVIGDTESDVRMGYNAGAGLTIGVLSGIGTRLDLSQYSDYVFDDIQEFVYNILPKEADITAGHTPLVKRIRASHNESKTKASLVIFDKDGTLLCFHSMWTPWIQNLTSKLEEETGLNLNEQIMERLGYCHVKEKWLPGVFSEGTAHQSKQALQEVLHKHGVEGDKAWDAIEKVWEEGDHSKGNDHLRVLDNPRSLFKILKDNGIKVAICTADSRPGTLEFVKSIGAEDLVDLVVCGDDPHSEPKPSARNALEICRTLGVHPSRALIVGDTIADMGMGKSAKLGATVGVLSGVGEVEDLDESADHIVPSISHILPLIFKNKAASSADNKESNSDQTDKYLKSDS